MQMIGYNALKRELSFWDKDWSIGAFTLGIGKTVNMGFSGQRFCKGYFDGERNHRCQDLVPDVSQCPSCRDKDITRLYACADERGFEEKFEKIKDFEYSIYLAVFGQKIKCGVTRADRLCLRTYEQGARHYAEVARVRGMKQAYGIEQYLQKAYGFANSASATDKLIEKDDISGLKGSIEEIKGDNYVGPALVKDPAIAHNSLQSFESAEHSDSISGKLICTRSSLVFFFASGIKYLDIGRKKGHLITGLATG
jgi:hypothetical protein